MVTDGISEAYRLYEETYEVRVYLSRRELRWLKQLYPNADPETAIHMLIHDAYYSTMR